MPPFDSSRRSSASPKKPFILKRNWVIFFCFSGCFIDFLLRFNLSVAIVEIWKEQMPCRNPPLSTTPAGLSSSTGFSDSHMLNDSSNLSDSNIFSLSTISSLSTVSSLSTISSLSTGSNDSEIDQPCYENKYDYEHTFLGRQFLPVYFYGLFATILPL